MGRTGCSLVRKLWLCFLFFYPELPSRHRSLRQAAALWSRLDSSSCCYLHTAKYFHWLSVAFWKQTFYFPQLIKLLLFKGCGETSMLQGVKNISFCFHTIDCFHAKILSCGSFLPRFQMHSRRTLMTHHLHCIRAARIRTALCSPQVNVLFFSSCCLPVSVDHVHTFSSQLFSSFGFWQYWNTAQKTSISHCDLADIVA